jgi:hypothetical protein
MGQPNDENKQKLRSKWLLTQQEGMTGGFLQLVQGGPCADNKPSRTCFCSRGMYCQAENGQSSKACLFAEFPSNPKHND